VKEAAITLELDKSIDFLSGSCSEENVGLYQPHYESPMQTIPVLIKPPPALDSASPPLHVLPLSTYYPANNVNGNLELRVEPSLIKFPSIVSEA